LFENILWQTALTDRKIIIKVYFCFKRYSNL